MWTDPTKINTHTNYMDNNNALMNKIYLSVSTPTPYFKPNNKLIGVVGYKLRPPKHVDCASLVIPAIGS